MPAARSVHVRLTSECQLNCPHCYASDWAGRGLFLADDAIREVLNFALENGCNRLTLTGGEPLLHPGALTLAADAAASRLPVEIETNGVLLSGAVDLLRPLAQWLRLRVSYDGDVRGRKWAARTFDACLAAKDCGLRVEVQVSLYGATLADPHPVLGPLADAGLVGRVFLGHAKYGRGAELERVSLDRARELARVIRTYPGLKPVLPALVDPQSSGGDCGWRTERCEIMPDGTVTACGPSTFERPGWNAGNMREEPLQEIWDHSPFFQELRGLTTEDFESPCHDCPHFDGCGGACRAVAWSVRGSLLATYPWCHEVKKPGPDQSPSVSQSLSDP